MRPSQMSIGLLGTCRSPATISAPGSCPLFGRNRRFCRKDSHSIAGNMQTAALLPSHIPKGCGRWPRPPLEDSFMAIFRAEVGTDDRHVTALPILFYAVMPRAMAPIFVGRRPSNPPNRQHGLAFPSSMETGRQNMENPAQLRGARLHCAQHRRRDVHFSALCTCCCDVRRSACTGGCTAHEPPTGRGQKGHVALP